MGFLEPGTIELHQQEKKNYIAEAHSQPYNINLTKTLAQEREKGRE